jgi:hypothetical protein
MNMNDLPRVQYDLIRLQGGLDLLTPTLFLQPGFVRDAKNFEVSVNGGYTRIAGYERFDGRTSPSTASFGTLTLDAVDNVAVGDTITGPSGNAVVAVIDGLTIAYTKLSGTFAVADAITQGVDPVGTVTAVAAPLDSKTSAQYSAAASNIYRADIQAVPGSGPIRGVVDFNGTVYAWRNNAGGTAMDIHKSTNSGWSQVVLGSELAFDTGILELFDGNTINGATSGATAVIDRVLVRDGTWEGGDAEGTLVLSSVTGTFQAGESIRIGSTVMADAVGAQTAITLAPGGRVQAVTGNFGGLYSTRVYGCDSVNRGFEFDGTVYAPISTGMADDTPDNIAVHANHLFFGFDGSLQFSGINEPYRWSPVFGAGEIAMRGNITSLLPMQGSNLSPALVIYSSKETNILYGTSSDSFSLVPYSINMGGNRYTSQRLDTGYVFDDRGIISLNSTDKFGNFDAATLTYNIRPVVQSRRTSATASGVNRERSQYRVFFSDGYGLYMTIVNGKLFGTMPVQFPNPVAVWCESSSADGIERSFFGSTDGFVYQMDTGPSFDGAAIEYGLQLAYNSIKSPRLRKRYRRASIEVSGSSFAEIGFTYELGYGLPDNEQPSPAMYESNFSSSFWDDMTWDAFVWDGKTLAPNEVEMTGTAENVALILYGESDYISEFTINSVILHYSMRRGLR